MPDTIKLLAPVLILIPVEEAYPKVVKPVTFNVPPVVILTPIVEAPIANATTKKNRDTN